MSEKSVGQWVTIAICAVALGSGLVAFELGPEPSPSTDQNLVEIVSWNWRKNVSGKVLAVFGTVRNKTPEPFGRVVLELRIEDNNKTVLARHSILVGRLEANADKPFREDIPRSGQEATGYLEVKSLIR